MRDADYEVIGSGYTATRRADPRLAASIWRALGDARTVVNVGAGAGAYEPTDREVVAVEPATVMIDQRPPGTAPVVRAAAEELPFADSSFDAALAVLSDHHWRDRERGLREMLRVARRRVVLFNADPAQADRFWLTREYLPQFCDLIPVSYRAPGRWERELRDIFGQVTLTAAAIPHDCVDGFYGAFWQRPAAYVQPDVRDGISVFARLGDAIVGPAIECLQADLGSGAWVERHHDLLERRELELGYYVVTAELVRH